MAPTDLRFRFSLARELHMTVGELDAGMSAEELVYWKAFAVLEAEEQDHRRAHNG